MFGLALLFGGRLVFLVWVVVSWFSVVVVGFCAVLFGVQGLGVALILVVCWVRC